MVRVIGLTGGIGTGKSTVAALLRRRGIVVLDADQFVRELQQPGEEGLRRLVETFGDRILTPGGELDRPALARIAFSDAAARATLEGILHPLVRERMAAAHAAAVAQGADVIVHEIPLLFESRDPDEFDATVLVYAPAEEQVQRLIRSRGMSEADARARVAAQLPIEEKRRLATHVIDNTGSIEDLEASLGRVWRQVVDGGSGSRT